MAPAGGFADDGEDAFELCTYYWFVPDEWQKGLLRDWTARDEQGRLNVLTAGLSVPRQNGKNGAVEALEFYLLVTDPDVHILHTAHQVKTCKRAFNRLAKVFSDKRHPEIMALVRQIRRTNGEEGIYLWHPDHIGDESWPGASIEYSARSRSAARGFDKISHIIYDEAQELTDEQVEALLFTLGASETDRFVLYTGTPPGPNCPGEVFARTRRRALTAPTPHMCWHEWGIVDLPGASSTFADLEPLVWETNPAMGVRLSIEFTEEEFANTSVDGFARERLGWWAPDAGAPEPAMPRDAWEKAAIDAIGDGYRGVTAFGVKFSPDGASYALAGCKMRRDRSECAFELVEVGGTERGTRPLAQALADRAGTASVVVVDGMNGASALCDNLGELGVPRGYVVRPRTADVIASAQGLVDAIVDGKARHSSQPSLDEAAAAATARPIGNRGGWGFDGSIAMEACALAVWGARGTRRDPTRRQRIL